MFTIADLFLIIESIQVHEVVIIGVICVVGLGVVGD